MLEVFLCCVSTAAVLVLLLVVN